MSWLLTALLLVNGVGINGFGHAHVGGDECHSHADDWMLAHEFGVHQYSHYGDHPTEQPHQGECDLTANGVLHTHLSLFGIDFSIPDSDDSHHDDKENPSSTFVRFNDNCNVLLVAGSLDIDLLRTLALSPTVVNAVAFQAAPTTAPQVPTAPLCDCARFERSGVLLI